MSWLEAPFSGTLRITDEVADQKGAGIAEQNERVFAMKASKQYLRFCGIDMAKQKHVACIIDRCGKALLKPKSIRNNTDGFQQHFWGHLNEAFENGIHTKRDDRV